MALPDVRVRGGGASGHLVRLGLAKKLTRMIIPANASREPEPMTELRQPEPMMDSFSSFYQSIVGCVTITVSKLGR